MGVINSDAQLSCLETMTRHLSSHTLIFNALIQLAVHDDKHERYKIGLHILVLLVAEDRIDGLLQWASTVDIYAPRLQAGHINGLRGMIAAKKIKKGGLLMSIPRKKALMVQDTTISPFPELLTDEEWSVNQQ